MLDLANVLTLIQRELRDARRNRWLLLYGAAFACFAAVLAWTSLSGVSTAGLPGFSRVVAGFVNLAVLFVPLMGLTMGAMGLAGERERGILLQFLAQPVTRLELLLGKYLGLALALLAVLAVGFGLSGFLIAWQGATGAGSYLVLVLLTFLLALATLSLGLLVSTCAQRSATAVGIALFLWLVLAFLSDLGLMGTALVLKLEIRELFLLALLNPLQVFKMAGVLSLRSNLEALGPAGLYATQAFGNRLLPLLMTILACWIVLPLAAAYLSSRLRSAL